MLLERCSKFTIHLPMHSWQNFRQKGLLSKYVVQFQLGKYNFMLLTKIGCVFFWFVVKNAKIIFMGPFWYLWCLSKVYWKFILHNWLSSNFWILTRIFYHIHKEVFGAQTLRKLHLQRMRIYKGQTNHDNDQPNERNILCCDYTIQTLSWPWLGYAHFCGFRTW